MKISRRSHNSITGYNRNAGNVGGITDNPTPMPDNQNLPNRGGLIHQDRREDKENYPNGLTFDADGKPIRPKREWYNYLPFGRQAYEDAMAEYQEAYDLWMLNNQRDYDSPKEFGGRLGEAGLNPNLSYGMYSQQSGGKSGTYKPDDLGTVQQIGSNIARNMQVAGQIVGISSAAKLQSVQAITEASKQGLMGKQQAGQQIQNEFAKTQNNQKIQEQGLINQAKAYQNYMTKEWGYKEAEARANDAANLVKVSELKAKNAELGLFPEDKYLRWLVLGKQIAPQIAAGITGPETNQKPQNWWEKAGNTMRGLSPYF